MHKLVFSHDIFAAQSAGGVSRCMIELMRALATLGVEAVCWDSSNRNRLFNEARREPWADKRLIPGKGAASRFRLVSGIQNELRFASWVADQGDVIVHRTYYPWISNLPARIPIIETLHDMWDERSGSIRNDRNAALRSHIKRRALQNADLIVCVSNHTMQELGHIWPWALQKAVVIHHGTRRISDRPVPAQIRRPYFLFVGKRGLYKNFDILINALSASPALGDLALVCFGGGPFEPYERENLRRKKLEGRVVQLQGGDAQLAGLYEGAKALLYPSKYEGFGLPILEAMSHSCPVIVSPLTSLPEVCGDAALYAAADDPDAWRRCMETITSDDSLALDLIERGHCRAGMFSWETSAEAHIAAYSSFKVHS